MNAKAAILALLGLGAGMLLIAKKGLAAPSGRRYKAPMMISKNFDLADFLKSSSMPELKNYSLSEEEMHNAALLVQTVLQPLRDKFGPIMITGGFRPPAVKNQFGQTFYDVLKAAGAYPSKTSDHILCAAADIATSDFTKMIPAYNWLKSLKAVRQVILESRLKNGVVKPAWIHVAVATENLPQFAGNLRAFAMLDGKRIDENQVIA